MRLINFGVYIHHQCGVFHEEDNGGGGGGGGSLLGGTPPTANGGGNAPAPIAGLFKETGDFADGWLNKLPEEFKDAHQILGQFKDMNGVLKSLVNQQRLLGKKGDAVQPLTDKSTPEEIAEYRKKMGIPESVEKYPTKYEGMELAEDALKEFNGIAHKLNLSPAQVSEVVKYYAGIEAKAGEAAAKAKQEEFSRMQKTLADAWGEGEAFNRNKAQVERMALTVGLPTDTDQWTPDKVCIALQRAANLVSNDKLVSADSAPTMQTGKAKANSIMFDTTNPLHAKWQEGDKATVALIEDLLKNAK